MIDDFVIILYGEDNLSYWTIPLRGHQTDSMGYFVMGVATTVPHPQFIFANGELNLNSNVTKYFKIQLQSVHACICTGTWHNGTTEDMMMSWHKPSYTNGITEGSLSNPCGFHSTRPMLGMWAVLDSNWSEQDIISFLSLSSLVYVFLFPSHRKTHWELGLNAKMERYVGKTII